MSYNYFAQCKTKEEAKKLYHKLAKDLHPDHGGSEDLMKELNVQYENFQPKDYFKTDESFYQNRQNYGRFANARTGSSSSDNLLINQLKARLEQYEKAYYEYKTKYDDLYRDLFYLTDEIRVFRCKVDDLNIQLEEKNATIARLEKELLAEKKSRLDMMKKCETIVYEQTSIYAYIKQKISRWFNASKQS